MIGGDEEEEETLIPTQNQGPGIGLDDSPESEYREDSRDWAIPSESPPSGPEANYDSSEKE